MRIRTHRLTLAAAVVALSGPAALTATEYKVRDFFPLAVGNSWTLGHTIYDPAQRLSGSPSTPGSPTSWSAYEDSGGVFTMRVERTEEIGGHTYYVLSGMPAGGWPPAPRGFSFPGKKLRWKGTHLMEHTGTGEQTLYAFGEGPEVYEYDPLPGYPVPRVVFGFPTDDLEEWVRTAFPEEVVGHRERGITFLARYGMLSCAEGISASDFGVFLNEISAFKAVLIESAQGTGGASGASGTVVRRVTYDEALRGLEGSVTSAVSSSSWGQVKASESGR